MRIAAAENEQSEITGLFLESKDPYMHDLRKVYRHAREFLHQDLWMKEGKKREREFSKYLGLTVELSENYWYLGTAVHCRILSLYIVHASSATS